VAAEFGSRAEFSILGAELAAGRPSLAKPRARQGLWRQELVSGFPSRVEYRVGSEYRIASYRVGIADIVSGQNKEPMDSRAVIWGEQCDEGATSRLHDFEDDIFDIDHG
jgi:hypothetical protein